MRDDLNERPAGVHMGHPMGEEMTMCGFAVDAFDGEPMDTARAGELVTCPECRRVIKEVKAVKRWRMPPLAKE